jgi:hypothetical protein
LPGRLTNANSKRWPSAAPGLPSARVPWGIDLFDSPATLGKTLPKLVRSYALDAIDVATDKAMPVLEQEALRFVADAMAARVDRFPAVGLGEDLRLASPTLTGGGVGCIDWLGHGRPSSHQISSGAACRDDEPDDSGPVSRRAARARGGRPQRRAH